MKNIFIDVIPPIFVLLTMFTVIFGLPMESSQSHGSHTKEILSIRPTKGVESMSEMRYRCIQGMLHCKVIGNKIGIQYEKFPGRFNTEPVSEHQITSNNIKGHKEQIAKHRATIRENRNVRAKAKNGLDNNVADPDSYHRFNLSP